MAPGVNVSGFVCWLRSSKQAADADLNVKQQFATVIGDPAKYPLMTSAADNLQYQFVDPTNKYPMSPDNFGFDALRYNTSATYISLLTQFKDPRVFVTAEPAAALVSGGAAPTSYAAFAGRLRERIWARCT